MRAYRPYRTSSVLELEERVVLSHTSHLGAAINVARPPADVAQTLSPSAMVPGAPTAPAGGNTFPLDIQATLQAILPVYLQKQITGPQAGLSGGANIIDELIVPNPATGGSTTTEWIDGAGDTDPNGVERVVDVKTVSGNTTTDQITTTMPSGSVQTEVDTVVKSGNSTTHTNVTTLSDGTIQTRRYTEVQKGNTVLIKDCSQPAPRGTDELLLRYMDGRVQKHTRGNRTVTNETFNQPSMAKTTETVVTSFGDAGQNQVQIINMVHNPQLIMKQDTIVWRLNPPTS